MSTHFEDRIIRPLGLAPRHTIPQLDAEKARCFLAAAPCEFMPIYGVMTFSLGAVFVEVETGNTVAIYEACRSLYRYERLHEVHSLKYDLIGGVFHLLEDYGEHTEVITSTTDRWARTRKMIEELAL